MYVCIMYMCVYVCIYIYMCVCVCVCVCVWTDLKNRFVFSTKIALTTQYIDIVIWTGNLKKFSLLS